jgi:homoserine dehydrogenase
VTSDIADIARGDRLGTFGRPATALEPYRRAAMRMHEGGYYIRLSVFDRPGAFAAIAGRMAASGISLESIVQRHRAASAAAPEQAASETPAPVILITYETTESAIRQSLEAIKADGHVLGEPQMIRIEPLA